MADVDGLMGTSCDYNDWMSSSRCIYVHLIEEYYSESDEPVIDDKEPAVSGTGLQAANGEWFIRSDFARWEIYCPGCGFYSQVQNCWRQTKSASSNDLVHPKIESSPIHSFKEKLNLG